MRIEIRVIPNSKKEEIIEGAPLKVRVKEKAEKGKANDAVLRVLKRHFGRDVRIISGYKSGRKVVDVGY